MRTAGIFHSCNFIVNAAISNNILTQLTCVCWFQVRIVYELQSMDEHGYHYIIHIKFHLDMKHYMKYSLSGNVL